MEVPSSDRRKDKPSSVGKISDLLASITDVHLRDGVQGANTGAVAMKPGIISGSLTIYLAP